MKLSYRNQKNAKAVAEYWGKPLDKSDWYSVKALSDDSTEILIYDVIGWPYNDASGLIRHISDLGGKDILVRINSPGGDVFDGTAIFNTLKDYSGKVTVRIEGLAASMGSVIALAGKDVQAYPSTMMMIHEPWVYTAGNQYELQDIIEILSKISGSILDIYTGKTKTGKKEMREMMKAETWMTAKEAKEKGFVDTIIEAGKPIKAQFDLSMFANVPDELVRDEDLTERDAEKALRDAGFSRSKAKAMLAGRSHGESQEVTEIAALIEQTISIMKG